MNSGDRFEVHFWQEPSGRSRIIEWLEGLKHDDKKVFTKALWLIEQLEIFGPDLRAPYVKWNLFGPISELRTKYRRHTLRIYFWRAGRKIFIAAAGEAKKDSRPDQELLDYTYQAYLTWRGKEGGER